MQEMEYPEGATPLDPDEIKGLKHPHVKTRRELDELEAANIQEGLIWLAGRKDRHLLTDKFVRKLHKRLFGQVWKWAGVYRSTEKNIGVDPIQVGVQLRNLMDDAVYWVENDTYAPLEAAARFHHRLVAIHPFPNGNGRLSRIMADALLRKKYGEKAIDWSGGENLQQDNQRRDQYIQALRSADRGDYGLLLDFIGTKSLG